MQPSAAIKRSATYSYSSCHSSSAPDLNGGDGDWGKQPSPAKQPWHSQAAGYSTEGSSQSGCQQRAAVWAVPRPDIQAAASATSAARLAGQAAAAGQPARQALHTLPAGAAGPQRGEHTQQGSDRLAACSQPACSCTTAASVRQTAVAWQPASGSSQLHRPAAYPSQQPLG